MGERLSLSMLTQYFYPEVPGTAQISTDLALGLKDAGFDVSVYTGQPAFLESRRLPAREEYRGLRIHRAYSRRLSRRGSTSRLLNGATVATITLFNLLRQGKPDVVLVDSTSPFLLVAAWLLRHLRGVPYVFVVHDVYPDIAIQLGVVKPRAVTTRIWRATYRRVYDAAAHVVVLGPRMRDVVRRSLRPEHWNKVNVIPNWADGDSIVPRSREDNPMRKQLGLADKLVVLYSGNIGLSHDMDTLVEAADRLREQQDLRFLLVGGGGRREAVADMLRRKDLKNVIMLPYQPLEKLPYSLTCGDISVVTLERGIEGLSVPSKLYSSLAAGLAILAVMGPGSEVGDVTEGYRCGYRVAQGDVEGLVGAIRALHADPSLLADMRNRARACFESSFTRKMSISRYVSLLRAVAEGLQPDDVAARDAA
jgi:glycosyltransferase involved in cell wall biosynthesis